MAAIGLIRNKLGWLLIALMVVSLIAFILMGQVGNGGGGVQASDDLATINGETISNQVFNENLTTNINNYKQNSKQTVLSDADMNSIRNTTYNQMVSEKLFDKIYSETGIAVSDDEFVDMLSGKHVHPGIQNSFKGENGVFDPSILTNFINNLDLENSPQDEPGTKRKSWNNFEKAILKERLAKKYNNLLEKSTTIPSFMAKDQYLNQNIQVSFDYVMVPYSSIEDASLGLTDADLKSYLQNHAKEYEQDETVDLKFVSYPIIASENDKLEASKWIDKKTNEWGETKDDSLFINLYSDVPYDVAYYGKNELTNVYSDSLFDANIGDIFGPSKQGDAFVSTRLLDRKMIADSVRARHLLLTFENLKSQEEANAKLRLFDSLFTLVDSLNVPLSSLTAQFSEDQSNSFNGGDLKSVKPNQMVKPFNDAIFFEMKEGEVRKVSTQFGLHIVEVYKSKPTKLAVKVGDLRKDILASTKTQEKTYATASIFSGNNNTEEKFVAAGEEVLINNVFDLAKDANTMEKVKGNARQIIKWAFGAKEGEVSTPFSIGETYYVVLLDSKNKKGVSNLSDKNRIFVSAAAAKEKKEDLISVKMKGSDLNTIASSNEVDVASAQNITYNNVLVGSSQEPMLVGKALGMEENTTSGPIAGEEGVYVIKLNSKSSIDDNPAAYDGIKQTLTNQIKISVSSKLDEAVRKSANVEDNRFNFF